MPIATNKTDGTLTVGDHAAHHNELATAANVTAAFRMPAPGSAAVDTPGLNALLETARLAGGGEVYLHPGAIYSTNAPIVIGTNVRLKMHAATLKLATNANCNVIQSHNFAALTNTDTWTNVPNSFQIVDGFIDGNKANQGAGNWRGIALYGYGYRCTNFVIRDCKGVGYWSEGATASLGAVADQLESFIDHFKIHNCDGVLGATVQIGTTSASGMMFAGPHDSKINNGIMYYNGTAAGVGGGGIVCDIPLTDNANGSAFDELHIWGNDSAGGGGGYDYGIRCGGSGVTIAAGVEVESHAVSGVHFTVGGNRCDARIFQVGTTFRAGSKGVTLAAGVSAISGAIRVENCGAGALDVSTGGGARHLKVTAVYTAIAAPATVVLGTVATTDEIDLLVTDSSGGSTQLNAQSGLMLPSSIKGAARQQAFPSLFGAAWKPTGSKRDNYPRHMAASTEVQLGSGTLLVFAGPYLYAGESITALALRSGSIGATTPTNQWFCLLDQNLNVLAKTANDLTTAWATFTTKTLAFAPYVVVADVQTYVGALVTAATAPNFRGVNCALGQYAPVMVGTSTTGLTDPASLGATAVALTASGGCIPYCYVT